jgi:hypothetical protein
VRHLRSVSLVISLAGLFLLLASLVFHLSPTWTLVGLLLAWAGIVKLVVVHLWHGVAAPNTSRGLVADDDRPPGRR